MTSERIIKISSFDLPELQPYRTLRRPMEHLHKGIFIAEGEKVVRRLLESRLETLSLLLTPQWYDELRHDHAFGTDRGPIVYLAEKNLLEEIVGFNVHQGVMAMGRVPHEHVLEKTLNGISSPGLLVALEGLVNAENVGVIVRNCAAFGVDAIIVGETSSSPYLRRAVRNSMGAVFHVPVLHVESLSHTLQQLRTKHDCHIVGAHPHMTSTIYTADFGKTCCVIFGNEGEGLSEEILNACTEVVSIPMSNDIDSLNVSNASAVFLYEVQRQRKK